MHITVLKDETINGLSIKPGDVVVDGTLGGGGHTLEIINRLGDKVKIIGIDFDKDAIDRVKSLLLNIENNVTFRNSGFEEIDQILDKLNIVHVDKILLDLGISSFQLEDSGRGFSFLKNEPLLMTMKKNPSEEDLTAKDIVNTWGEESLADIIYGFGEEKYARRIAKMIVSEREKREIKTTFDLVKIIDKACGRFYKGKKIHSATKTFQALRIAVNQELQNLEKIIEKGFNRLSIGGRIAIISFHSLEDRIVKKAFLKLKQESRANIINKKPIVPSEKEIKENPRSRSAKLRIIEKI